MDLIAQGEPPVYFRFRSLVGLGVPHAATTRHCPGVGAWAETGAPVRAEAAAALAPAGLDLAGVVWARQVHGAAVARAPASGGFAGAADVLVSTARGVPLAMFTADCLAIVLCDLAAGALALAHVGWRGTVGGAAPAAVDAVCAAGGRADNLHAAIAPSIGPCCYEVDEPVIGQLAAAHSALWERWIRASRPGHWMLDLWTANEDLLRRAGVASHRIDNPRLCTACHPELLYSYRKGDHGRLVTIAALP